MSVSYHLIAQRDGSKSLTVFGELEAPVTVRSDHPHFATILELVQLPEAVIADVADLADLSIAVARRFESLSERVSVANGRVYFDGDPVDSSITRQIVRALDAGSENWRPLVRFMENVAANPVEHSREQLYDWLRAREFTINAAGEVIAYKGVARDTDGTLRSIWAGGGIVNGERVEGQVPQRPGDTVELPRSEVAHDPSEACSHGLHVGTYAYAQGYAQGALLKVAVNPRDVVSVPTDASGDKVRVCRYRVLDTEAVELRTWLDEDAELIELDEAEYEDAYAPFGRCECGEALDVDGECPEAWQ
jgi:hypothetical protein